jgi:hypothetical protein
MARIRTYTGGNVGARNLMEVPAGPHATADAFGAARARDLYNFGQAVENGVDIEAAVENGGVDPKPLKLFRPSPSMDTATFGLYPLVVNNPDMVERRSPMRYGKDVILFGKYINGMLYVVEEVGEGEKRLGFLDMYRKKGKSSTLGRTPPLETTSETSAISRPPHAEDSSTKNIPGESGDVQPTSETFPTPKEGADNAATQAEHNIPGETGVVNPDEAFGQFGEDDKGLDLLRFGKNVGGTLYVVDEVRTGRKKLALATMYKKKSLASSTTSETYLPPEQAQRATGSSQVDTIQPENRIVNPDESFKQSGIHDSPHRFDRFTLAAMSSGEGGQVHGWGLYTPRGDTENRKKHADEWHRKRLLDKKCRGRPREARPSPPPAWS